MDTKLLRSFVQLVDSAHYGKAAAKLSMTQSTLSKQIQSLETSVGGHLFDRGRHGAKLTPLGEILRHDAVALLKLHDEVDDRMQRASAGWEGRLDVAFGMSTLVIAPNLLRGFRAQVRESRITLNDMSTREQHRRILEGRLDAGFCRAPEDTEDIAFTPVVEEHLALVMPLEIEASGPEDVERLNQLGFVMLTPSRGPGLNAQVDNWCFSSGFKPRIVQQADDLLTVHAVVAAGLGAAFLPWHGVDALAGRTRHFRLPGPDATWPVGLCWHATNQNPLLSRFVKYVTEHRPAHQSEYAARVSK